MAGVRFQNPNPQFFDDDGDVLAGGSLTFYVSGTSTLADTYSEDDLDPGDANENPVDLDGDGRPSVDIFLDPAVSYRCVLKDADDATVFDKDPIGGADITAAIAAHNADPDAHQEASESVFGFTQYASQSETNTGTATDRAITPATLAGRTATETRAGVIELATAAEVELGVDTTRAVTPAGIQSLQATTAEILAGTDTLHFMGPDAFVGASVLANPGHYKLPGGLIFQFGTGTVTSTAPQNFTFPVAFATACFGVFTTITAGGNDHNLAVSAKTTTNFTVDGNDAGDYPTPFDWIAVGV